MGALSDNTTDMQTVETVLNKTFKTAFTPVGDTDPSILICQENVQEVPPDPDSSKEYIRLVVNYGEAPKDSRGTYLRSGVMTAQIFTPSGTGTGRSIEIGETIRKAFQDAQWAANVLIVNSVNYRKVGSSGSMYQANSTVSFQYYESSV